MIGRIAEVVCESFAFAEKLNLPSERLLLVVSAGAAGSWFLEYRGPAMLKKANSILYILVPVAQESIDLQVVGTGFGYIFACTQSCDQGLRHTGFRELWKRVSHSYQQF